MIRNLLIFLTSCMIFQSKWVESSCCGKVDIGPVYVNLDLLESGKTERTLDMYGVKGDATILVWNGVCLKPAFLWAQGGGELATGGIGLGHCTPIPWVEGLMITPSAGAAWGYVSSHRDFEEIGLKNVRERFRSVSGYLCLDVCYTFLEKWTLMASYQYAWSNTHTKLGNNLISVKSNCSGPSYAIAIEYSLSKCWAINLGGAYNTSLTKEKEGIRGKGLKLGMAYYF